MSDEENILYENNGCPNLLVSFGGIRQELGMPVFEFYKSLKNVNCDKCFLKDTNQAWYSEGIGNENDSYESIIETLRHIISNGNYKKVCFLGNSMGGYAAMLFGVILEIDEIVAFSPQTFIGKWHRFIYRDNRWKNDISKIYKNRIRQTDFFNLKNILKINKSYDGKINIYYSKDDRLDRIHAERLDSFSCVQLFPCEGKDHNLVRVLKQSGKLDEILSQLYK